MVEPKAMIVLKEEKTYKLGNYWNYVARVFFAGHYLSSETLFLIKYNLQQKSLLVYCYISFDTRENLYKHHQNEDRAFPSPSKLFCVLCM